MYCKKCGNETQEGQKFCTKCGESVLSGDTSHEEKKMGSRMALGIFLLPIVFSWFTLQKGYRTRDRVASFVWLGICILIAFASE